MKAILSTIGTILMLVGLLHGQQAEVVGRVTLSDGTPLQGVSIMIKGTNKSTTSAENGTFTIDAPSSSTLLFKHVGLVDVERPIAGQTYLEIIMEHAERSLDEVVVIGYGEVRKRDLTGSVATIQSAQLNANNPLTLEQGLQGKLAGVNVISNDGAPGGGMSIQIRGSNTFGGSGEPLYVVDGVPINGSNSDATPLEGTIGDPNSYTKQQTNALAFLDPRDIESVQVLKDASATAIFGSRGANGVVIIKTKSGKAGKPQLDFSAETSVSNIIRFTEVMSATEYTEYINDVRYWTNFWRLYNPETGESSYNFQQEDLPHPGMFDEDEGQYKKGPADYKGDRNVWQRAIIRSGVNQRYSAGVSGGLNNTTYTLRYNRADQQGIVQNTGFERNGLNFSLNQNTFDWLTIGASGNLALMSYNLVNTANTNDQGTMGLIKTAIYGRPIDAEVPLSFLDQGGFYATSSPLAYINTPDLNNQFAAFSNLYTELTFTPQLKLRSNVGYQFHQSQRHKYYNRNLYEGKSAQFGDGFAQAGFHRYTSLSFENTLTYDRTINRHHVNVMGTLSANNFNWSNYAMEVRGFGLDVTQGYDMGSATGIPRVSSGRSESSLMSYLGRINYNYDSRYYATASLRHDGASNFASNNKWATFYSFALAYTLSNEKFMENWDWLELFKLRYSYGFTGNQGIGPYASLARLAAANYPFEGVLENGYILSGTNPGNPNLKWETTRQDNLGIDLSIKQPRIDFTMDIYRKYTFDLLRYQSVAMSTGVMQLPMNIGEVENKGLELAINTHFINKTNFSWEFSANWSANRNKILKFGDNEEALTLYGPYRLEGLMLKQGHPIGQLYGYVEDGYWSSVDAYKNSAFYKRIQEEDPASLPSDDLIMMNYLGEIKYKDLNADGIINEEDRTTIGDVNPDFIYGFTNRFTYKDLSLHIFFQGVYGNDILNAVLLNFNTTSTWANRPPGLLSQAWTPDKAAESESAIKYPKLGENPNRTVRFSRRYVESGSYLKLRNITLSYRLENLLNIKDLKNITLTLSANNLVTFTRYSGFDPEVNSAGTGNAAWRGIDVGAYPNARTYMFGIQATF